VGPDGVDVGGLEPLQPARRLLDQIDHHGIDQPAQALVD